MSFRKLLTPVITATLTCLIVLSAPSGQAEVLPDFSGGLASLTTPNSSPAEQLNVGSRSASNDPVGLLGVNPFPTEVANIPDLPNDLPYIFKQADAGSSVVCGILANGRLMCWGLNDFGQAVPPEGKYKQVSVGQLHACAIKTNGRLKCWGENTAFPTKSGYRGLYEKVSAGDDHTCAISRKGTVTCWGNNDHGELNVPNQKFKDISAKANHTCGITRDDALVCWGQESFVRYVPPAGRFVDVNTGTLHGCATRLDDRSVVCWGNNAYGQTNAVLGQYKTLASGDFHTCGLRTDDSVTCWGSDEHGQQQIPLGAAKSIAAGGELSCGINMADKLWCRGSFAYNPYLFEQVSQQGSQSSSGDVKTQFIPFAFLGQLAAVVGGGLVNYGKGADKSWVGAEATGVKWQLGLAAGSIIFNALSSFLPTPPSKTELLLEDIQAKLEKLQQSMDTVAKDVRRIANLVAKSYCDQQLQALQSNVDVILNANRDYRALLTKVGTLISASANKQSLISPIADIQKFADAQAKPISDARANIGRSLLGYVSSSPLEACLISSVIKFKQSDSLGFDDRALYADGYRILNIALSTQAIAQMMEQDINIYKASRVLLGPLDSTQAVAPINLPPENLAGICETIRNPVLDPTSPRWALAKNFCDENTTSVKAQYTEYVEVVERLGAPYTDDYQLLSLSKDLLGYGAATRNLLWIRNFDDAAVGRFEHRVTDFGSRSSFRAKGNIDLYFDNGSSREGRWVPAGAEWREFFGHVAEHAKKIGAPLKFDFLEKMSVEKDQFAQKPFFSGIALKPFWMSGQTYDMNWIPLAQRSFGYRVDDGPTTKGMKCLVASGINKTRMQEVSGMVCGQTEMEAMTNRIYGYGDTEWKPYPNKDEGCGSRSKSTTNVNYCFGNGAEFLGFATDSYLKRNGLVNQDYLPYAYQLGSYFLRWWTGFTSGGITFWGDADMVTNAWFFPGKDAGMYVMPVLDVSKRQCLDSLRTSNSQMRQSFRNADDVKVYSECGKDLDRVVRDLIPRPDESIPEYGDLTKYVKKLRVN